MQPEKPDSQFNPMLDKSLFLWNKLRSQLRLFLCVALIVWSWMAIYTFTAFQPKYASQSLVLVKDSAINNRYVVPDQNYALQTTSSSSSNPVLNTMGLLKSESISKELYRYLKTEHPKELKRLGINSKAKWESYYGNGKSFIKAKNEPGTDLISVQFAWSSPEVAKEGLEVVLESFRQASLSVNRAEQKSRSQYLIDQVGHIKQRLKDIRRIKSQYKSEMKTVNLSRESDELARSGIELATKLNQVEASARGKEAEYKRMESMLKLSPENALTASAMGMNGSLAKLHDQFYELSQTHALLKTTLTDKNPKVREVRSRMDQIESDIKAELKRTLGSQASEQSSLAVADSTRGQVINQMVAAQAESIRLFTEAEVIRERMDQVEQKIQALPNLEQELSQIEEEERSLSSALYTLRQKELEARLKQAETLSNVFVVDTPQLPTNAKFPGHVHVLAVGFLLGLAAGAFALYLQHLLKDLNNQRFLVTIGLGDYIPKEDRPVSPKTGYATVPIRSARSEEKLRNLKERLYLGLVESDKVKDNTILDHLVGPVLSK